MVNRTVLVLLFITLLVQGCASHQVLGEHFQKGMLVKEEGTGVVAERSRKKMIELTSPLSVRVYEVVERQEPGACTLQEVPSVLSREHVVEEGTRPIIQRQKNVPRPDKVSLFVNGFSKGDLEISSDDVATVDLHAFPELAGLHKPLKLTFKYYDAYAYSVLQQAEVERIFGQSAPAVPHGGSR